MGKSSFKQTLFVKQPVIVKRPVFFKQSLVVVLALACLSCSAASKKSSKSSEMMAMNEASELSRRNITYSEGDRGYNLQLIEKGDFSELEVAFNSDSQQAPKLSRLENPPRIVLDLNGSNGPKAETIETPESLYINRVRVAEHPDKSRVVLDLSANENLNSEIVTGLPGQYTLKLSRSAPATESKQLAMNNSSTAETKTELKETTLAEPAFSDPVPAESFAAETQAEPAVMAQANEEIFEKVSDKTAARKEKSSNQSVVSSYELQSLSSSENTLIISGENISNFSLKRTAPSEYVLSLPSTTLAESAQQVLVAPAGSGAIRSVRPNANKETAQIRIFTDPERSLQAESSHNGVVISAAMNNFEMRAQAAPEILEKTESVDDEIAALLGDKPKYSGRLISLDLQDTDIDNALRIIAEVSNLNIIASEEVTGKITLRLVDVPWDQALDVILKTNGLDMIQENNVVRIAPVEKLRTERESLKQARQAEEDLEPLSVRYVRISYAKAAELKPLVESVLSERGTVAYDERTNQLIIKDIRKGIVNVAELIAKLDLRTPQVLLETQIVEATTSLARDLGSQFGFNYVQSPGTGNATGYNFPNSVTSGITSDFAGAGSAITLLLESADGTRSLSSTLTALESEGRVKVVSRPAVATTNNKQATIKSVETIRIKQPDGGLSVATGQGASANGTGTATEEVEIGIILEVTPQASPDYFVLLDINAKSSTLGSTVVDGIPSEIERSATSSVLVSSGQTFAMGGIYKTSDSNSIDGIPFLKDIPVFGAFFRRNLMESKDEELLFFITPRIIEGSFDDAAMKAS